MQTSLICIKGGDKHISCRIPASIYNKKSFTNTFQAFCRRKTAIRKCSLRQNPWKLSVEKLICSEVPGTQQQSSFFKYYLKELFHRYFSAMTPSQRCKSLFSCKKYERKTELVYFFCSVHLVFHFTRYVHFARGEYKVYCCLE